MTEQNIPDQFGRRPPTRDILEIGTMAADAVKSSTAKAVEDVLKAADAAEEIARMIRDYATRVAEAYRGGSSELEQRIIAFSKLNKDVEASFKSHHQSILSLSPPMPANGSGKTEGEADRT